MKTFTVNLLIVVNQIVCRMYGQESLVLDKGKLEGALSPFDFSYDTDEVTYAKVFRNLVVAHGFQDGNKRTACLTIKAVAPLKCSDIELANMALDVAQGKYRNDIGDLPQRMFGVEDSEDKDLKEDAFGGATQVSNIGQHKRSSIDLMEEDEDSNDSLELKVSNN